MSVYQELALARIEASIPSLHSSSLDGHTVIMHDINFSQPLIYTEDVRYPIETTVILDTEAVGSWKVTKVASATHEDMETHAHGSFLIQPSSKTVLKFSTVHPVISLRVTSIVSRSDNKMFTTSSIYEVFFPRIVKCSKDYRVVQTLRINAEGYATIQLPDTWPDTLNIQHDHLSFTLS